MLEGKIILVAGFWPQFPCYSESCVGCPSFFAWTTRLLKIMLPKATCMLLLYSAKLFPYNKFPEVEVASLWLLVCEFTLVFFQKGGTHFQCCWRNICNNNNNRNKMTSFYLLSGCCVLGTALSTLHTHYLFWTSQQPCVIGTIIMPISRWRWWDSENQRH